jgi:CHAT domain-containing protein
MKLFQVYFKISLFISLFLIPATPGNTQSGNQSDVTGPDPIEVGGGNTGNDNNPPPPTDNDNNPPPGDNNLGGIEPGDNNPAGDPPGNTESANETQQETESVDRNQQETTQEETEQEETTQEETEQEETTQEEEGETEQEETTEEEQEEDTEQEEEEKKEETTDKDSQSEQASVEVDRSSYDTQLQQAQPVEAIQLQEEFQAVEVQSYLGIELYGNNPHPEQISASLFDLGQITGKKSALIYVSAVEEEIITFTVFPNSSPVSNNSNDNSQIDVDKNQSQQDGRTLLHRTSVPREQLLETIKKFQEEISDEFKVGEQDYLQYAQQLYQWIIAPIEDQLKANGIDILVFTMDTGIRSLPISALHDGQKFLIEKYAVAIIPSFGLTHIGYVDVRNNSILAMGASQFRNQIPLPAVPIELETVVEKPRQGERFLNENFTINNFKVQNEREPFAIIHLGTHAEFQAGDRDKSYIQFFDDKLSMSQLLQLSDELGWSSSSSSPVELLVLSACQTALGDRQAELGFAGLAVAAGVKSVLASLWNVSDLGTLGLMGQFYQEYGKVPNKAEALRQAQLALLKGQVRIEDGKVFLANGEAIALPPDFPQGTLDLSHPYYWAAFTLIGNWN